MRGPGDGQRRDVGGRAERGLQDPSTASGDCGAGSGVDNVGGGGGDGKGSGFADAGGTGTGSGFVDPSGCASDCQVAAVNGCGVDGFTAQDECVALCASSPTQAQLACLAMTPCTALVSALQGKSALCGITSPPDGGAVLSWDASGPGVDPATCASACQVAAVIGCNVDGFTAQTECMSLCARSPTQSQLACVQAAPCSDLLGALRGETSLCGIGGGDAG